MPTTKYTYSGNQWLLIDLASMYACDGLDKKLFEQRLDWGRTLLPIIRECETVHEIALKLKPYIDTAEEPEMFCSTLLAIHDTLKGEASGYMVGLDAASSGPQLLSVLTRCVIGMGNTGAIGSTVPDLYTTILANIKGFTTSRKKVKKATVPHIYGSTHAPMKVFGEKTYPLFLQACKRTMPRAEWAKTKLLDAWDGDALFHQWKLPDGAVAHCVVVNSLDTKGKFGKFNYTYRHDYNKAKRAGDKGTLSIAANVTHSYDAYVLRELHRRCNYNYRKMNNAIKAIQRHLKLGSIASNLKLVDLARLAMRYNTVSVVAIEYINRNQLASVPTEYLEKLLITLKDVVKKKSFLVRTIHDEFASLPNYCTPMKFVYNTLLLEAYRSTWLMDVITDLTGICHRHYLEPVDPIIEYNILHNVYSIN